jgi:uncharacterized protein YndB with AHSA1/START domain
MRDILHRIGIKASPEKMYVALSEDQGLAGWCTRDTKESPSACSVNQFRFGDRGSNQTKVVDLVPSKRA